jgi:DNA-binding NarL/FixJ family response regulator
MNPIRILIADDHKLLRELWTIILNSDERFNVIAGCSDGQEAIELVEKMHPDIVIMDLNMVMVSGLQATEEISNRFPAIKVIGVSAFAVPKYARQMIQVGAKGYVTKNSSKDELIHSILEVHKGSKYICREIRDLVSEEVFSEEKPSIAIDVLTERELQIIEEIRQGLSSREIAETLKISLKTVEVHRHNILKKLNLRNVAALVNFVNMQPKAY